MTLMTLVSLFPTPRLFSGGGRNYVSGEIGNGLITESPESSESLLTEMAFAESIEIEIDARN